MIDILSLISYLDTVSIKISNMLKNILNVHLNVFMRQSVIISRKKSQDGAFLETRYGYVSSEKRFQSLKTFKE